jgi:hypothetical protein
MAKVLVVTSGKGGVGKTTSTAALGGALAHGGDKVVVVDFDVGLRNLDLVMGAERRVVYDLINVAQGDAKLPQALIRDKRVDTLRACFEIRRWVRGWSDVVTRLEEVEWSGSVRFQGVAETLWRASCGPRPPASSIAELPPVTKPT